MKKKTFKIYMSAGWRWSELWYGPKMSYLSLMLRWFSDRTNLVTVSSYLLKLQVGPMKAKEEWYKKVPNIQLTYKNG